MSARLFPNDSLLEILGHSILLSWACIVTIATFLGLIFLEWVLLAPFRRSSFRHSTICSQGKAEGYRACFLRREYQRENIAVFMVRPLGALDWPYPNKRFLDVSNGLGHRKLSFAHRGPLAASQKFVRLPDCKRNKNDPRKQRAACGWATGPFSGDFLATLNNLPATVLFRCSQRP